MMEVQDDDAVMNEPFTGLRVDVWCLVQRGSEEEMIGLNFAL